MSDPQASRSRPPGETAGSQQRSSRRLVGAALSFDLLQEADSLRQEESWQRGDRNARTLLEEPGLRIVLTGIKEGARIREHRTKGWVSIQTLEGYIRVESPDETVDMVAGRLLALEPGVPHDVVGIEQSVFLLTIVSTP
jgi:quercetin dioxygenase-like cupin family protein